MKIGEFELRRLRLPMKEPFETSFGREEVKEFLLLFARIDGVVGAGECVASAAPLYSYETNDTAWSILENHMIPLLLGAELTHPDDVRTQLAPFRGHNMAKSAIETAVWDAYAKLSDKSLASVLGGVKTEIEVGISVGIQSSIAALLKKIEGYLEQGFKRIKVKVKPGWDVGVLRAIRGEFGDIPLMADANSAYRLEDADTLQRFDEFGLTMIEQPLGYDDIVDHAQLQTRLTTPICLDESIHSTADARKAIDLGACRVINIKIGRVGGLSEARDLQALCLARGVPAWCGGMLESGIGRLANIAVTSLPGFTLPGDTAPSARYFEQDFIEPEVAFTRPGILAVPQKPGIGAEWEMARVERFTVQKERFSI